MDNHECIKKGCMHLKKIENAPYWVSKEKQKLQTKINRAEKKNQGKIEKIYLQRLQETTSKNRNLYILSVKKKDKYYEVKAISFKYFNYVPLLKKFSSLCDNSKFKFYFIEADRYKKELILKQYNVPKNFKSHSLNPQDKEENYLYKIREATKDSNDFYAISAEKKDEFLYVKILKCGYIDYAELGEKLRPLCDYLKIHFEPLELEDEQQ